MITGSFFITINNMKKKNLFSMSRVVQLLLIVTLVIAFTGYKTKLEKQQE